MGGVDERTHPVSQPDMTPMELYSFLSAIGEIAWSADENEIVLVMAAREHRLVFAQISGAGVALLPAGDSEDASPTPHLLVAPGEEANYLLRIPLPADQSDAAALEELLRNRLRERWIDDLTAENYRQRLMPAATSPLPAWALPAAILAFVGLSALLLSVCVIFSLAGSANWRIFGWQSIAGFILWLAIVGAALYAYRRIWMKS